MRLEMRYWTPRACGPQRRTVKPTLPRRIGPFARCDGGNHSLSSEAAVPPRIMSFATGARSLIFFRFFEVAVSFVTTMHLPSPEYLSLPPRQSQP